MKVILKIKRWDPAIDKAPYFQDYTVEVEPTDRVLDALMRIKRRQDGSLAFRKSCAHGLCGSDAVRINGKDRLACKTLIQDVFPKEGEEIKIEPLNHFRVLRDLIVDQEPFFEKFRLVKPYLINNEPLQKKERLQSPDERKRFDEATQCILCSTCYSACPILDENPEFLGPSAIVQAARFIEDSRDRGFKERFSVLDAEDGVWPCQNHFECTKSCPRGIKITRLINQTKKKLTG